MTRSLLQFHRSAEAAGYPALQLPTMLCLGLVLAAIGLMQAAWTLALALLSLVAAIAVLARAIAASVMPLERIQSAARRPPEDRKAA